MKRAAFGLVVSALLACTTAAGAVRVAVVHATSWRSVVTTLRDGTRVPVLLPAFPGRGDDDYYVTSAATASGYGADVTIGPPCHAEPCKYFSVRADTDARRLDPAGVAGFPARRVRLAKEILGWYEPVRCPGGHCRDAKVIWQQHGAYYAIDVVRGDADRVVTMANSAIRHGPW